MVRLMLGVGSWEGGEGGECGGLDFQIQVKIASEQSEQDDCSILSLPPIDCEFLYTPNSYFYDFNYDRANSRNH